MASERGFFGDHADVERPAEEFFPEVSEEEREEERALADADRIKRNELRRQCKAMLQAGPDVWNELVAGSEIHLGYPDFAPPRVELNVEQALLYQAGQRSVIERMLVLANEDHEEEPSDG